MKINNKDYKLFLRADLKDEKNHSIDAEIDYDALEITLNSDLPLNQLHNVCNRIVLSVMLSTTKQLADLTERQKDYIVGLVGNQIKDIKTISSALVAYFSGLNCDSM